MTGCSAVGCSNRTEQGYCMKVFPRDPKRRELWAAKVKRLNWVPTDRSFLCEVHFDADQWEKNRVDGKRKLKCDAVPTIFHHSPMHSKRKPPTERSILQNKRLKVTDPFVINENENIERFDTDVTKLKQELMHALEIITQVKKENAMLKSKLRLKAVQMSKYKKSRVKQYVNIFNEDQLEAIQRKNMAFTKWLPKTIETALGLKFSCGIKGYENLLHLGLPYPSNRTLQRRLKNLKFQGGILHEAVNPKPERRGRGRPRTVNRDQSAEKVGKMVCIKSSKTPKKSLTVKKSLAVVSQADSSSVWTLVPKELVNSDYFKSHIL